MPPSCNCISGALNALRAPPQPILRSNIRAAQQSVRSARSPLSSYSSSPSFARDRSATARGIHNYTGDKQWNNGARRLFSSSAMRCKLKTMQQIQSRNRGGPFNLTAAVLFVAAGAAMWAYFTYEKERLMRQRIAEQTKGVGRPKVGGPFELVDQNGQPFSSEDMKGKYALVYFGFTHCPDICPDELDKMALMIDKVKEKRGNVLLPIMITCDPARDTPAVLKEYLKEFHPDIIGLTGSYDAIKQTCKAYRVYFSTPQNVKPGQDYLVDHSIYFYLMDPEGDFVEAIGRQMTADHAAKVISDHVGDWKGPLSKKDYWA